MSSTSQTIRFTPQSNFITSPTQIPGLSMWLDANDISTLFQDSNGTIPASNGSAVILWRDKSPNSNHFYNAPAAVNSSNPSLVQPQGVFFQPRNLSNCDIMASSNVVAFSAGVTSIFLVIATTTNGQWLTLGTNTTDFSLRQNFGFNNNDVFNTRPTFVNGLSTTSFVAMAGNSNYFILDGVVNTITTQNYSTKLQFNTTFLNRGSRMFIQSLLIYSNALTLTQRQQIQGWLAWNYTNNNNLTRGHPYALSSNNPGFSTNFPQVSQGRLSILSDFSPTQLSGCSLWLDAADSNTVLRSGSNVTQWNDKSGNGRNGTANGTVFYANSAIGGLNTISFTSVTNSYIRGNIRITGTTFTCFAVATLSSTSKNDSRILSLGVVGSNDYSSAAYSAAIVRTGSTNTFYTYRNNNGTSSLAVTYSVPFLICALYDGSTKSLFINSLGTSNSSTGTFNISNYQIGSSFTEEATLNYGGFIGEEIVFSNALTTAQRQQVEGYLAWKWGINTSLPITHPYYYNANVANIQVQIPRILVTSSPSLRFNPTSIAGLALWLDAADQTTVQLVPGTANVSNWRDKSGNARHAAALSPTNALYSNTINNNRVITMPLDTTSAGFQTPSFTISPTNSTTCFIVFNQVTMTGPNGGDAIYLTNTTGATAIQMFSRSVANPPNASLWFYSRINGTTGGGLGSSIYNTARIYQLVYTPTTTTMLVNGLTGATYTATGSNIASPLTLQFFVQWTQGYACEVLLYNNALSDGQRQQVEGYLAWKWGINTSLPITHPNRFMPVS